MKYVALLRGVNVGGNNKVDMKELVAAMEGAGFEEVSTYINSGNIFFRSVEKEGKIVESLEALIKKVFGIEIRVLLRSKSNIDNLVSFIPEEWKNDKNMKCDVMFLWEKYDDESVISELEINPEIDDVRYVDGALIWKVNRKNATRSGMMKLVGTEIYANMTVRNCNTVRKIQSRLGE